MLELVVKWIQKEWDVISKIPLTMFLIILVALLCGYFINRFVYQERLSSAKDLIEFYKNKPVSEKQSLMDNAELSIRVYGDERAPSNIKLVNIYRWYFLNYIGYKQGHKPGELQAEITGHVLYINFENPVKAANLEVMSPDIKLPLYEEKQFNERFAIITFGSKLPAGTLNIIVHP